MTLTIIFVAVALAGISLVVWGVKDSKYCGIWREATGTFLIVLAGIALIVNLLIWIPSKKDSEIDYQQLLQEKQTIEIMLDGDEDVDRLLLNQRVIDYNNRIIAVRENSQRHILKDYYSKDVDWQTLELIEWR